MRAILGVQPEQNTPASKARFPQEPATGVIMQIVSLGTLQTMLRGAMPCIVRRGPRRILTGLHAFG